MIIEPSQIKGTKFLVPKGRAKAVQKALFKCDYGYELNFDKDFSLRKIQGESAFFVDHQGLITFIRRDDCESEKEFMGDFYRETEEEINYECLF